MLQHSYPNKVEFKDKNGIRVTYFNSPHKAPSNYPLKYVRYRVYHCQIGDHSTGVNAGYIDRVHCGNSNDRFTHGNHGGGDWNIVGPKEAEKRMESGCMAFAYHRDWGVQLYNFKCIPLQENQAWTTYIVDVCPWECKRVLLLAAEKNTVEKCPIAKLPVEIIQHVIEFLQILPRKEKC